MYTALPLWFEVGSVIALLLILAADLGLVLVRPHVPAPRESSLWVGFYVALALTFALLLFVIGDSEHAGQFLAGWLTEYSLSVDNLFVFVLIMARFAVPRQHQQQALMAGVLIALLFRGVFILLGAGLIASFTWIFYLFGAFLLYAAIHQALSKDDTGATGATGATGGERDGGVAGESEDNAFVRFVRHHLRISTQYDGRRLRTTVRGRGAFTPMLIVFIALGSADLLFALDSIPAIFGITTSPFLVFAANVFALMGLRQLYFLLGHLLVKLEYLTYGIAFILFFIGVKLVLQAMHHNTVPFINGGNPITWAPEIGTWTSLGVIVVAMAVATMASLVKMRFTPDRGESAAESTREGT